MELQYFEGPTYFYYQSTKMKNQSTTNILEIQFPENVKSIKERREYKLKKLMEMPETLTADYKVTAGVKVKCDLVFFTQSPGAWHATQCL